MERDQERKYQVIMGKKQGYDHSLSRQEQGKEYRSMGKKTLTVPPGETSRPY